MRTTATYTDKTRYIAGVNAHLGYKAVEDGAIYAIVGYKYLRLERFTNFDWDSSDAQQNFNSFDISSCLNNNGWAVGVGALMNLECNFDIRLEAIYAGFGTKCYSDEYEFKAVAKPTEDSFKAVSAIQAKPSLFYGVVSLAYNF
jgi:opacity protein-like surface antigen